MRCRRELLHRMSPSRANSRARSIEVSASSRRHLFGFEFREPTVEQRRPKLTALTDEYLAMAPELRRPVGVAELGVRAQPTHMRAKFS